MACPNSLKVRHPRWKTLLFCLTLIALVLVILEFTSILYLKLFHGYDGKHLLQYEFDAYKNIHPTRNYVDTRGIRHNSVGFRRSTEVPLQKPDRTYRIFLMGASTAYGLGTMWTHLQADFAVLDNSETIDAYLEDFLAEAINSVHIEVINAAITSTWTHHHLIYLNQSILRYDPDMVVFVDGRNDYYKFHVDHDQFTGYAHQEHAHEIMGPPTLGSLAYMNGFWLYRKSACAYLTFRGLRDIKRTLTARPDRRPIDVESAMDSLRKIFPANALKMNQRLAGLLADEEVAAVFVLQPMLIFERERAGMPPIERRLFQFNVDSIRPNSEEFMQQAVAYIRESQRETVEKHGAIFIDATGIYEQTGEQIFTDYCHLTPKGNAILAATIADRIIPLIQESLTHGSQN